MERLTGGLSLHRDERGELSGGAASGAHGGASVARLDERLVAVAPSVLRVRDFGGSVTRGGGGHLPLYCNPMTPIAPLLAVQQRR